MQKQKKSGTAKSKAEVATARKNAEAARRKAIETREKEDKYWEDAEGPKSRSAMKREEEAKKRAEGAARKAETRRFAEEENMELEKYLKKTDKKVPKVTQAELRQKKEEEQAALQKKVEEVKRRQSRTTAEEEYERRVLVKNTNRETSSIIDARTIEEAIAHMTILADPTTTFKAFEKAELRRLKEEKPGLKDAQYKDMVSKLWKRSHLNPVSQRTDKWKQQSEDGED